MDIQSLAPVAAWFLSLIVILIGLAVGSFLNVVIYRVPREMSIVTPRSHCPACHTPIRISDNIPLFSFIRLKGRCRWCGQRISIRYPLVELITAMLFWVVWRVDGLTWLLLTDWAFVSAMIALAMIDLEHRLLPDRITYPGFVLTVGLRGFLSPNQDAAELNLIDRHTALIGSALIALSALVMFAIEWLDYHLIGRRLEQMERARAAGDATSDAHAAAGEPASASSAVNEALPAESSPPHGDPVNVITLTLAGLLAGVFFLTVINQPEAQTAPRVEAIIGAWVGATLGAGTIWLLRAVYFVVRNIEGVGFGDIKMMMMVGAYLGWSSTFLTLLLASLLGSLIGVMIMIRQRDRFAGIPYGLFIAIAAVIALLAGKPLVGWYWAQM
ncbi:MAG: prepilin peptidase [Acidobacteriota bacterium]|nr:prepilin peptidase [Blastocatellia bacterium]MDW8240137.1 prepilin peptidase [Acidobacteriota bacterium]